MGLKGHATDKGLEIIKNQFKEKVKYFILVGDTESNNEDLDNLIKSSSIEYSDIKNYIFNKSEIGSAYYDKDSILTFELPIDYESDYNKYIYAVGIVDTDDVLVGLVATPKVAKLKGIGGSVTYKMRVKGEAGKLIFEKSDIKRASQEEAEEGKDNFKLVTSLNIKQHVDKRIASEENAKDKDNNVNLITPKSLNTLLSSELSNLSKEMSTELTTELTTVSNDVSAELDKFSKKLSSFSSEFDTISELAKAALPFNSIIMWGGSVDNIPVGWALCDGNNGTPDLRDRFVIGAGNRYKVSNSGGSLTHTHTGSTSPTTLGNYQMPSHSHGIAFAVGGWGDINVTQHFGSYYSSTRVYTQSAGGGYSHEHRMSLNQTNSLPPYYALCFIMKIEKIVIAK